MDHFSTPLTSYSQQGNATAYAPEQEWQMDSAAFMRISADPNYVSGSLGVATFLNINNF
jgi:hypothetical protein